MVCVPHTLRQLLVVSTALLLPIEALCIPAYPSASYSTAPASSASAVASTTPQPIILAASGRPGFAVIKSTASAISSALATSTQVTASPVRSATSTSVPIISSTAKSASTSAAAGGRPGFTTTHAKREEVPATRFTAAGREILAREARGEQARIATDASFKASAKTLKFRALSEAAPLTNVAFGSSNSHAQNMVSNLRMTVSSVVTPLLRSLRFQKRSEEPALVSLQFGVNWS